jgi:GNAT superfamily N-acetyltransferase
MPEEAVLKMKEIYTLDLKKVPDSDEARLVKKGLADFNSRKKGIYKSQELMVFLKDEHGATVGGLLAFTFGEWLSIQTLWIEENVKGNGWGSRLLAAAESEAVERGCLIADLRTFSFQAPDFYRKNGYEMFGELENAVGGESVFFFRKKLK